MAIVVLIDGALHTGNYQATCDCSFVWHGQGQRDNGVHFSPALPIAEAVAHVKLAHVGGKLEVEFTDRFTDWLVNYWQRESARQAVNRTLARNAARRPGGLPAYGSPRS